MAQNEGRKRKAKQDLERSSNSSTNLPVRARADEFLKAYREHSTVVLVAETGSGKSTQIPRILMEQHIANNGPMCRLVCTQPRRMAAITLAERVAQECGEQLGEKVGYAVRFDDRASGPNNVIRYATDGVVLREAMSDRNLSKYGTIILDEAHERSLQTDILFGLVRDIQRRRKDLKCSTCSHNNNNIIPRTNMFTTLKVILDEFFSDAIPVNIPGRQFNVQIYYTREKHADYVDSALVTACTIHETEGTGDVLIFMPGQEDIEYLAGLLQHQLQLLKSEDEDARDLLTNQRISNFDSKKTKKSVPSFKLLECSDFVVLPFFASATMEQQQAVFRPASSANQRKFIIATNIAETSVTISGVRYVVDAGLSKRRSFSASTGMDTLKAVSASKAEAKQRSGRAGREAAGKCWRLYTEPSFEAMIETEVPEIQRVDLSEVILQLLVVGVRDVSEFDFISTPEPLAIAHSLSTLLSLEAIDKTSKLTPHGKKMASLPLSPIWSHTLILSQKFGCVSEILTCAAVLSVEPILLMHSSDRAGKGTDQSEERKKAAAAAHRSLIVKDGDLPTFQYIFDKFYSLNCQSDNLSELQQSPNQKKQNKIVFFDENSLDANNSSSSTSSSSLTTSSSTTPTKQQVADRRRWATQHCLSWRALERAGKVREQLATMVELDPIKMNPKLSSYSTSTATSTIIQPSAEKEAIAVGSEGNRRAPENFLKCLACGLFLNVAMALQPLNSSSDMVSISTTDASSSGGVAVNMNLNQRKLNISKNNKDNSAQGLRVVRLPLPSSSLLLTSNKSKSVSSTSTSEFAKYREDILKSYVETSMQNKLSTNGSHKKSKNSIGVGDYLCSSSGSYVDIHPSSFLFGRRKSPKCVVFSEIVTTSKPYMRSITAIDPNWLVELVPHAFKYEISNSSQSASSSSSNQLNNHRHQSSSTTWRNPAINDSNIQKKPLKRNFMVD